MEQKMKKFVKVTAITALVLVILGVILVSVGAIGGGVQGINFIAQNGGLHIGPEHFKIGDWMDTWEAEYNLDDATMFHEGHETFVGGSTEFTADGSEVEKLYVEMGGSHVQFLKSAEDTWRVEADGIGKFQVFVQDGTLYVMGVKKGVNISFSEVKIYVPENAVLYNAELNIGAGEMELEYLTADEIKMSVGAGNVKAGNLTASALTVDIGAGEMVIRDSKTEDLEVSVGAGSFEMEGMISGNVNGEVAMGSMELTVYGSRENDHNYELDCAAGSMTVGSRSYSGLGTEMSIDNGAATTYELDCAMGELNVRFHH